MILLSIPKAPKICNVSKICYTIQSEVIFTRKEGQIDKRRVKLAKTAKAPRGFYTAKEVMQKLGIANSTLYHYVDTGKIKKVIQPVRKEGYYLKSEVDKIIREREIFIL